MFCSVFNPFFFFCVFFYSEADSFNEMQRNNSLYSTSPGRLFIVAKFSELGVKERCRNSLFQQKLSHNTALCVPNYVYEVNLFTFLESATQIHGDIWQDWIVLTSFPPKKKTESAH